MADIFVSYASEDRDRVAPLVEVLEADGFSVWWDRRIGLGSSFDREIERELNAASCVVVLWSPASVESDWVREEAGDGLERDILVPAWIEACRIPLGFRRAQAADLSSTPIQPAELARFLDSVRSTVEAAPSTGLGTSGSLPSQLETNQAVVDAQDVSVLVLPLTNLSPDPENAYFADGLTAELISDLSKIESLRVISQTSAMLLKDSRKSIGTIAGELNVRYVLEGSVRRAGHALRINVQLIDAEQDSNLWTEKYSGTLDDVFDLQEHLSRQIVGGLRLKLTDDDEKRLTSRPIQNVQAYNYYLRAKANILQFDRQSIARAIADLQSAIDILGDNVLLIRAMGLALWQQQNLGFEDDPDILTRVERAADRIRELDSSDAGSYLLLGLARWFTGNCRDAVVQLREAYRRDRTDSDTLLYLGVCSLSTGQMDFARDVLDEHRRIDPLAPISVFAVGYHQFFTGRFQDAAKLIEQAIRLDPDVQMFHWPAVRSFISAGEVDRAKDYAGPYADFPVMEAAGIFIGGLIRKTEDAPDVSGPLRALASRDSEIAQYLSDAYAFAGDGKKALEWLKVALHVGFLNHTYLARHDPFIADYRDTPEWSEVMQQVKDELQKFESELQPLT